MGEYECRTRLGVLTEAVEDGEHEDGGLAHTGDGLAENIDTHNGLGYAFLLHVTRVLETAIDDRLL